MGNIIDYLEWRGDLTFDVDPFNEVDNLVLSELAYVGFDGLVPHGFDGDGVPLKEIRKIYFAKHPRSPIRKAGNHIVRAPLLMDSMVSGKRFSSVRLTGYVNIVDADDEAQMAAVTFLLGDGTAYVAFRGTDTSIVGWKEDFNMSYLPMTEGQRQALRYLNTAGTGLELPLRVGGHSKGGNFAVYAAAFCSSGVRDRISEVYSNDGPGFRKNIMESEEYRSIIKSVTSIVPDTSIVGMLLSSDIKHRFIKSDASVFAQHDPLTWQVGRNRFVTSSPSELGRFIKRSQRDWLSKMSDEDREIFVNTIFSLFESTGMGTFDEIIDNKRKAVSEMIGRLKAIPKERQKEMNRIVGELLMSSRDAARETISERRR